MSMMKTYEQVGEEFYLEARKKKIRIFCGFFLRMCNFCCTFAARNEESCLSGRKSRTRNAVYTLRCTGGSNPSLSAKKE